MRIKFSANFFITVVLLSVFSNGYTQATMGFEEYEPVSTLKVKEHKLVRSKFPFIDVHNHQWEMPKQNLPELLHQMDALNMQVMVNLSGRSYKETSNQRNGFFDVQDGDYLMASFDNINTANPNRLILFTNISFVGFGEINWVADKLQQLEAEDRKSTRLNSSHG